MKNTLAENLLRFGVKNLTLENKSSMLTEQTEPDLSKFDWSKGGNYTWANANVGDIIKYILARDENQPYSNFEVYEPIFNWFAKNKTAPNVKESLLIWCSDDPYYGLPAARANAKDSNTQYSSQEIEPNYATIQRSKEWNELLSTLKGTSPEDKQVAANMKLIATAFQKAGETGLSVDLTKGKPATFKDSKYPNLKYLPTGGYTQQDVEASKTIANNIVKTLATGDTKNTVIKQDNNLRLIKADNVARAKLLASIDRQVQEKINNPQFRDTVVNGSESIPYVISRASYIEFNKASISTNVGTKEQPGSVDTVSYIEYQWPEKGTDQETADNLAANFFPDDGIVTSFDSKEGMRNIARKIASEIRNAKQKYGDTFEVVSIAINTFASTSTVNTSFGSKTKKYSKANNIPLVNARFKSMQADMTNFLTNELEGVTDSTEESLVRKIVAGQRQNFANAGPEWEMVGGNAYGQSYSIESYGPLFQEAYRKNPKLTPKQFYSVEARKNPAILRDYEISYAGYRKAWIWVTLQIKGADAPDIKQQDVVIAISGKFESTIMWPDKRRSKPAKGSKSPRYAKPKNNLPDFGGRSVKCPVMF